MKKLTVYLKDYRKESVLAPLFKMLEALFDLFVPLVVAAIIDRGIAGGERSYILQMCGLLVLLAAIGLTCSITAQFFAAKASVGFAAKLRQALFDHIGTFSFGTLDTLGTNTLITRMTSDINQVQNGLNLALRLLLRSPFIVFGAMIMAFTIDFTCALVFVVAIPLLCVVVFGIMLVSIPMFRKVQAGLDKVLGITRENLTGVRVIRAFNKEESEIGEFDQRNETLTSLQKFVGRFSALMNPVTYVIINVATIVLIQQGALKVQMGSLTQGEVVALYNYMAQILVELVKLANLIISITKALACASRVEKVLEVEPGMVYPESGTVQGRTAVKAANGAEQGMSAPEPENSVRQTGNGAGVTFRDVTFTYEGAGAPSLSEISFTAKSGQTIGIIGGTGSGKTSLVNLIPRFYDVQEGTVMVDGRDVRSYAKGELLGLIGVVPQRAALFEGTIRDNMRWGKEDATDEEIWQALSVAQAKEVVEGKNGQLDFHLEQGGRNLSGGQKQRLTIARALVKKPRILILDDSASALDFATDAALRKAIREMEGSATVFIVSQRTSSIRYADRILVLDDGKLAGQGTHEELLETCEVYQEIYYSQYPDKR
ncbi:MAG: ABC transporter ATP-binding protein [Eubacteriales bacterium]|nr:ABC transporter ATP-binding protein [Eubacteriales bacterium]